MDLDFIAGCVGGGVGVIFGFPLDTVKVHIQTQEGRNRGSNIYKGTVDCFSKLLKTEGVRGLFKGVSSPLVGVAAINGLAFGTYGKILQLLPNPDSTGSVAMAGASAGLIQSFLVSPMELIKTRMQLCGQEGVVGTLGTILRHGDLSRGLSMTILREVPAVGIYFGSYDLITREFGESMCSILTAGGIAGTLSWMFTYPQDVIKSRLQADGFGQSQRYRGPIHCLSKGLKNEGHSFLFRGLGSMVVRAFPLNAVTFGAYSLLMKHWGLEADYQDEFDTHQMTDNNKNSPSSKMSTMATDMPNIITIEEPLQSFISHARMYPEQMLWACPQTNTGDNMFDWSNWSRTLSSSQSFSNYTYSNFNQFSQRNLRETYKNLPSVMDSVKPSPEVDDDQEPRIPSMLGLGKINWTAEDQEKWRNCITTEDFLIPINLRSSRPSPHRIYGFYYIVS